MAAPNAPASDTMSVFQYTAGARTRNVVNIADVGGASEAYVITANAGAPNAASDGFANFRQQKTLHVVIKNTNLKDSGPANITMTVTIYGYNSSLGGVWAPLTIPISKGDGDALEFKDVELPAVDTGGVLRCCIPIEGVERIAAKVVLSGTRDSGSGSIWLGVNTI